jgi:hypothetical protein
MVQMEDLPGRRFSPGRVRSGGVLFAERVLTLYVSKFITMTLKRSCKSLPDIDIWPKLG